MSHALLLRLFLSPSFFSVHVALRYLMTYSDNIGITYYLTRRLSDFTLDELRDVWGFICHLLVSRPSPSRALECFVTDISRKSTHFAILTLWFMQASLKDYSSNPQSPQALICQRILHMCHDLIFGDLPSLNTTPYPTLATAPQPLFVRKKVKHHVSPTLVGMGMLIAGTPAHPAMANVMGLVAVEQGRADTTGSDLRSLQENGDSIAYHASAHSSQQSLDDPNSSDDDDISEADESERTQEEQVAEPANLQRSDRLRTQQNAASTSPALPLHLQRTRRSRFSDDPLGQLDQDISPAAAVQSTPSLSSSRPPIQRPVSLNETDMLLAKYSPEAQRELLRKHFCRSEIQFVLALENISNRLLVVPKPARVSALRAELTALNHKLPAEVCMPLWCSSTDGTSSFNGSLGAHHRIVRIPPGECVVLNSAERAPYLLVIEILHGDLDFDPVKRANRAILQKIVAKENDRTGSSRDLIPFAATPAPPLGRLQSFSVPLQNAHTSQYDNALGVENQDASSSAKVEFAMDDTQISPIAVNEDEEVDLVEQLYGTKNSIRTLPLDLSDSVVLPPAPKNRDLDLAAWSRTTSLPGTPSIDTSYMESAFSSRVSPGSPQVGSAQQSRPVRAPEITLQEYSDRMRTAAVMLAQLNANLVWEAQQAHDRASNVGALGWLSTGKWFTVLPPVSQPGRKEHDNVAPSTTGMSPNPDALPTATPRMKLQPADAAAIRERIMDEMLALEEERMERMRVHGLENGGDHTFVAGAASSTADDEGVIRRALTRVDPSALVFSESWAAKKARVRQTSPYGHLANWDCASVIVKTGGDLRQEQLACALVLEFSRIWREENCACWCRPFHILITSGTSGLIETVTDAVSIHSIKKAEYQRRLTIGTGKLGHVTILDHFKNTYGDPSSAKFARAQLNFAKSLAGYSVITYLLQIKDRHNGNILLDRDGHIVHIDFGFMLSNSPGNMGFEASPFKLPLEYVDVLGGLSGAPFAEFRRLFSEGFKAARKHCDRIVTMVELMQRDSTLPCFATFKEQTAVQLRDRFQQALTQSLVEEHVERLIDTSLGSHWTRLYDSYQYYSQSIL